MTIADEDEVELLPLVNSTPTRTRTSTEYSTHSSITNDSTHQSSIYEPLNNSHNTNSDDININNEYRSPKSPRRRHRRFGRKNSVPKNFKGSDISLLRSSPMKLVQIYIPTEIIHYTLQKFGEYSILHVIDLNKDENLNHRPYISDLRRFNLINHILTYFREKINEAHIPINTLKPHHLKYLSTYTLHEIDELEQKLKNLRSRVEHLCNTKEELEKQEIALTEERWVYEKFNSLLNNVNTLEEIEEKESDETMALMAMEEGRSPAVIEETQGGRSPGILDRFQISNISGVISKRLADVFERILWRTFYGNVIVKIADIDELFYNYETKEYEKKCVFTVFAHGVEMCKKIRKLADSLDLPLYDVENNEEARKKHLHELKNRITDLNTVLLASQKTLYNQLTSIAGSLEEWYAIIMKERNIYKILSRCKKSQYLKGGIMLRAWITAYDMDKLYEVVEDIKTNIDQSTLPIINEINAEGEEPPTRQETNKFTEGFQNLIDAYGIAKYQEVNPGIFSIVTFPFIFAIMFGDSGHGMLMAIFGLVLILLEKRLGNSKLNDIVEILYTGRYIIFMMGLFSIFTGIIYNDCFSKSFVFSFKKSLYKFVMKPGPEGEFAITKGYKEPGKAFLFGMDPGWIDANNSIIFMNSFKMKMSIIIGIIQMSFGVCLNVVNDIYFNNRINIFCEFIPEIIMLNSLFGYLCLLIIKKWMTDWTGASAPGLLNLLINMVLKPGHVTDDEYMYFGQSLVQFILLVLFVVCIFWLLLAKPYVIFAERHPHSKYSKWRYHPFFTESKIFGNGGSNGGNGEEVERLMGSQYKEDYDPLHNEDELEEEEEEEEIEINNDNETNSNNNNNTNINPTNDMESIIVDEFLPRRQKEERPFVDIIMDQIIHTIEFTLNCISNTASYLRLWALSLAHAQLSAILFDKIFVMGYHESIPKPLLPISIFIIFAIWFFLTVVIMCAMEGMSAFLHTLRLHWVEFNGKFYKGTGYKFTPFSFQQTFIDEKKGLSSEE